jgi:hypothetical protein
MTNPTSNFGWQMPTSTDLVTDLPADFEVFGQAVDTSLADLKGGTTGQVLKKNTDTDMDFVWAADSAGMTNPMTTTGDTIYSSSGSTPARLGIGSTGNVLTVSGGLPVWSAPAAPASETLITSGTLGGNNTTTISSISQAYTHLRLVILNYTISSRGAIELRLNSTNDVYGWAATNSTTASVSWSGSGGNAGYFGLVDSAISTGTNYNSLVCDILYYTDTTANKMLTGTYSQFDDPTYKSGNRSGTARIQSAINAIAIKGESTRTLTGNWYLYGVK